MDWITDEIAIGNFVDARTPPAEVAAILCLRDPCDCEERDDVDVLALPLVDGAGNHPAHVASALRFLEAAHTDGEKVLVHCHAGRSRSVAIVARYLMDTRGLSPAEAIAAIAAKREIRLTPGIESILTMPL